MRKQYSTFYVCFLALYIIGRICMVSSYTIGQESVRDIKNRLLPQSLIIETATTIQNEKRIPAQIRKKTFQKTNSIAGIFQKPTIISFYNYLQTAYYGYHIDPPKLV